MEEILSVWEGGLFRTFIMAGVHNYYTYTMCMLHTITCIYCHVLMQSAAVSFTIVRKQTVHLVRCFPMLPLHVRMSNSSLVFRKNGPMDAAIITS